MLSQVATSQLLDCGTMELFYQRTPVRCWDCLFWWPLRILVRPSMVCLGCDDKNYINSWSQSYKFDIDGPNTHCCWTRTKLRLQILLQLWPLSQNWISCRLYLWPYGPYVLRLVSHHWFSLKIENVDGSIPASYQTGGIIILVIFVCNVLFWASLWIWGARKRELLRREIVERQLSIIRREEEAQEQADLEEERKMI